MIVIELFGFQHFNYIMATKSHSVEGTCVFVIIERYHDIAAYSFV